MAADDPGYSDDAWNERFDEPREIHTADAVVHDPAFGPGERHRRGRRLSRADGHAVFGHGHRADRRSRGRRPRVYRPRVEAAHTGTFVRVAPTNGDVSIEGRVEIRIEDAKVAETCAQHDSACLSRQLGVEMPGSA
jgi:hypothetical protein